jgi:hypothetical protein
MCPERNQVLAAIPDMRRRVGTIDDEYEGARSAAVGRALQLTNDSTRRRERVATCAVMSRATVPRYRAFRSRRSISVRHP